MAWFHDKVCKNLQNAHYITKYGLKIMFLYANLLFAHIKDFNFFFFKKVPLIFKMWIVYSIMTNRGFAFSRYFLKEKLIWYIFSEEKICTICYSSHVIWVYVQSNSLIRKCSIKALDKWKSSVYILIEICHHRSIWLDSKWRSMPQKYIYFYLHNKLNFVPQLCNTT